MQETNPSALKVMKGQRKCQNCKKDFTIESEDFEFYKKIKAPAPTFCPECRLQRRLIFMNERFLYKDKCGMCGKNIISMYAPEKKLQVYCNTCWWSDDWDGEEYAQEFNPNVPFFEQLKTLNQKVPQMALAVNYSTLLKSEYINHAATSKKCYLIYIADECENVLYSEILMHVKDSADSTILENSELCYDDINVKKSYKTCFSEDCEDCNEVYFSKDCKGCSNCFGCFGLRNKSYYFFNQKLNEEKYQNKLKEYNFSSFQKIQKIKTEVEKFWLKYPHKFARVLHNHDVTGDYVYNSKNSKNMYMVSSGAEDSKYCQIITMKPIKDCYDYTIWGNNSEKLYECMTVGEGANNVKFSYQVWPNVRDIEYGIQVVSSNNMFGCSNIRNKKYCILNKQYSQEDYFGMVEKIKRQMNDMPYIDRQGNENKYGEFLPTDLSLFSYNESYANNFFPLDKKEVAEKKLTWFQPEKNKYTITKKAKELPDNIQDVEDSILKEVIECSGCQSAFRIMPAELNILRTLKIPIPHSCQNCRSKKRWEKINKPKLYKRTCQKEGCKTEFETTYAPNRPEIVYCEKCYNQEVI